MQGANDKNRLEDYLKRLIEEFDEAPSDDVWRNIEANLNEDRKALPLFWWLSAAALILLLLFFGGYRIQENHKQDLIKLESRLENDKSQSVELARRIVQLETQQANNLIINEQLQQELELYKNRLAKLSANQFNSPAHYKYNKSDPSTTFAYAQSGGNPVVNGNNKKPNRVSFLEAAPGYGQISGIQALNVDMDERLLVSRSEKIASMFTEDLDSESISTLEPEVESSSIVVPKSELAVYTDLGHSLSAAAWQGSNHQAGLLYSHAISDKLSAHAGIGYWEKNESYSPKTGSNDEQELNSLSNERLIQNAAVQNVKQSNDLFTIPIGLSYQILNKKKWNFGLSAQWAPVASISQDLILDYNSADSPTNGPFQDRISSSVLDFQSGTGRTSVYAQFRPESAAIRFDVFYDRWLKTSDYSKPFQQVGLSAKLFFHHF